MMRRKPPVPVQLEPRHVAITAQILRRYLPNVDVRIFGSRATGKAGTFSDLDLLLQTTTPLPIDVFAAVREAFDESDLPMRVDLLDRADTAAWFLALIEPSAVPFPETADP